MADTQHSSRRPLDFKEIVKAHGKRSFLGKVWYAITDSVIKKIDQELAALKILQGERDDYYYSHLKNMVKGSDTAGIAIAQYYAKKMTATRIIFSQRDLIDACKASPHFCLWMYSRRQFKWFLSNSITKKCLIEQLSQFVTQEGSKGIELALALVNSLTDEEQVQYQQIVAQACSLSEEFLNKLLLQNNYSDYLQRYYFQSPLGLQHWVALINSDQRQHVNIIKKQLGMDDTQFQVYKNTDADEYHKRLLAVRESEHVACLTSRLLNRDQQFAQLHQLSKAIFPQAMNIKTQYSDPLHYTDKASQVWHDNQNLEKLRHKRVRNWSRQCFANLSRLVATELHSEELLAQDIIRAHSIKQLLTVNGVPETFNVVLNAIEKSKLPFRSLVAKRFKSSLKWGVFSSLRRLIDHPDQLTRLITLYSIGDEQGKNLGLVTNLFEKHRFFNNYYKNFTLNNWLQLIQHNVPTIETVILRHPEIKVLFANQLIRWRSMSDDQLTIEVNNDANAKIFHAISKDEAATATLEAIISDNAEAQGVFNRIKAVNLDSLSRSGRSSSPSSSVAAVSEEHQVQSAVAASSVAAAQCNDAAVQTDVLSPAPVALRWTSEGGGLGLRRRPLSLASIGSSTPVATSHSDLDGRLNLDFSVVGTTTDDVNGSNLNSRSSSVPVVVVESKTQTQRDIPSPIPAAPDYDDDEFAINDDMSFLIKGALNGSLSGLFSYRNSLLDGPQDIPQYSPDPANIIQIDFGVVNIPEFITWSILQLLKVCCNDQTQLITNNEGLIAFIAQNIKHFMAKEGATIVKCIQKNTLDTYEPANRFFPFKGMSSNEQGREEVAIEIRLLPATKENRISDSLLPSSAEKDSEVVEVPHSRCTVSHV